MTRSRMRSSAIVSRWTARPIDVDILLIEGETVSTEQLTVPHPLFHQRAFVLVPLADLTGDRDDVVQLEGAEWAAEG